MQTITQYDYQPVSFYIWAEPHAIAMVEAALEEYALAITSDVNDASLLTLLVDADMVQEVEQALTRLKQSGMIGQLQWQQEQVAQLDWVAKVQSDFPPVQAGQFFIYRPHDKGALPRNKIGLCIDAVSAFGTGEHETTAGCLMAMQAVKRRYPRLRHILDMGAGTAILAVGAAKLWKGATVRAFDNDKIAVRVSQHNAVVNQVPHILSGYSNGYHHRAVLAHGRYDLIIANILAVPLKLMAVQTATALCKGGMLILSGILNGQVHLVEHAYQQQGFQLIQRQCYSKWAVLTLRKL